MGRRYRAIRGTEIFLWKTGKCFQVFGCILVQYRNCAPARRTRRKVTSPDCQLTVYSQYPIVTSEWSPRLSGYAFIVLSDVLSFFRLTLIQVLFFLKMGRRGRVPTVNNNDIVDCYEKFFMNTDNDIFLDDEGDEPHLKKGNNKVWVLFCGQIKNTERNKSSKPVS